MSIEAGFQGQKFIPHVLEKLDELALIRQQLGLTIEVIVDGGVKPEQLNQLRTLGVDGATVGSYFWTAVDPVAQIDSFLNQL